MSAESAAAASSAAAAGPFTATHTRARRSSGAAAATAAAASTKASVAASNPPTYLATHTKAANKRQRTSQPAAAAAVDLTADDDASSSEAEATKRTVGRPKKKPSIADRVAEAQKREAAKAKRVAATISAAKKIKQQQLHAMNKAKSASQKKNKANAKAAAAVSSSSSESEAESSESDASSSESESDSAAASAKQKKVSKTTTSKAAKPAPKDNVKRCRYCSRVLEGRGISAKGAAQHLEACKKRTPAEREAHNRAAQQRSHAQKMKRAGAWGGDASDDESSSSSSDDDDGKKGRKRKRSKSPKRRVRSGPLLSAEGLMKQVGYDLAGITKKKTKAPVFEVEAVRDRRFNPKTLQYEYLIKWCEFSEDENTWEPAATTHCRELIHQYHLREEESLTEQIDDAVDRAHRDPPEVAFHRDGLCTLTKKPVTLPAKEVAATEAMVSRLFNSTLRSITNRDQLDVLESRGFDNFKLRQRGRYDLTLDPATLPFLPRAPWLPAVKAILGGTAKLQHVGCMMSLPSSETQPWHSDGPHRNKDCHLPAYMANVFMPLIDMTRSLGGTQFQPGSHVHHDFHIRTTSVTPILKAGQSLIFDYRIRHRGLANSDTVARPLLYFTYSASDAIVDDANFAKGRYKPLPALIPELEESREERMKKRQQRRGGGSDSDKEDGEEGEQKQGAAAASAVSSSSASPIADAADETEQNPPSGEHKEAKRGRGRPRKSTAADDDASSSSSAAASLSPFALEFASSSAAAAASSSSAASAAAASPMTDDDAMADRGEQKRGGAGGAKAAQPTEQKSRTKSKKRGSASASSMEPQAEGESKHAASGEAAAAASSSSAQAMQLD